MMTTNKQMFRCLTFLAGVLLCTLSLGAAPKNLRIIQTNSAGDRVSIVSDDIVT